MTTIKEVREALLEAAADYNRYAVYRNVDRFRVLAASLDGMVLVPREPDAATLKAMADVYDPTWGYSSRTVADDWARDSYKAMLTASEATK